MELTPQIKAQLAEQKKQCIFCRLISGEIPGAKKVFEDDKTISLIDITPVIKGHCTYMVKEHYPLPAYMPGNEFNHKFSLVPGLTKAIKKSTVKTGMNIFIAMGGAAEQQSPHFLLHFLPREIGDSFFNFMFKGKPENILEDKSRQMLANNLPIMMTNHFKRHPNQWHIGVGEVPKYLEKIYNSSKIIYDDEKVLCVLAQNSIAKGHLVIYSKTEEEYLENLSQEESAHLFFTASFASTAVFEGLSAHGSNIIVKSGESEDNPDGKLEVHIIPRWGDDGLKLRWAQQPQSQNLEGITSKIKDNTWDVKFEGDNRTTKHENNIQTQNTIPKKKIISKDQSSSIKKMTPQDEIKSAIKKIIQ